MWVDDQMDGHGTYLDNLKQTIFTGQMKHGKKDSGVLKMPNGDEYHGKFDEDGLYTGYSELRFKKGNSYHGDFKSG